MTDAQLKVIRKAVTGQLAVIKKIEVAISNGKKRGLDKRTIGFYKNKIAELEALWTEYSDGETATVQSIIDAEQELVEPYTKNERYAEIQFKYSEYMSDLLDGLEEKAPTLTPTAQSTVLENIQQNVINTQSQTQLPRINLPTFSGEYSEWRSFCDMFTSLIHKNSRLEPVQKLHYLKGCLSGDAERLIKHIPVTNEDYLPTWEKLTSRYDNKRLLANTQLQKLVNQPRLNMESNRSLRLLLDVTDECLQQLKALKIDTSAWDTLLLHLLVQKLPLNTVRLWEEELGETPDLPNFKQFTEFVQKRATILESIASAVGQKQPYNQTTKTYHVTNTSKPNSSACPMCNENHYVGKCKEFLNLDVLKRRKCIQGSGRCFNCFSNKHVINKCPSTFTCRICQGQHHVLLHGSNKEESPESIKQDDQTKAENLNNETNGSSANKEKISNYFNMEEKRALLATALVKTKDRNGRSLVLRCLVDPGSQASFVSEKAAKVLGINGIAKSVQINGLNENTSAWANRQITIPLVSCYDKMKVLSVDLLVIEGITESLPAGIIKTSKTWKHIQGLELADPNFWKPGPIDILLGVTEYARIIEGQITKGSEDTPVAIKTLFGWILMGSGQQKQGILSFFIEPSTEQVNDSLVKFWETEEVIRQKIITGDEQKCEENFKNTYIRLPNGQYQVRLPFIDQMITLGSSRDLAIKRFEHLKRKFNTNEQLKDDYSNCLNEYITLGHMKAVEQPRQEDTNNYYIPHHAVYKESTTTKLRVVFDASAKTYNGKSLNSQLYTGPTIQPRLYSTLLKWRKYPIAMTADIEKMYRMILIHPDDRKYQRIVWTNPTSNLQQDYELQTVTFGTSAAPYLAIRTLNQLAEDEAKTWPLASKGTRFDFYVDDLLTGADTVQEAIELQQEYIKMLRSGKFNLRKWSSNKREILQDLPIEHVELKDSLQFEKEESIKTLGIQWIPSSDYFTFAIKIRSETSTMTKRTILSEIASLYDPVGWIAPVVVIAKLLMQTLWISGCAWDTNVNEEIVAKWKDFRCQLVHLELLKIPRWLGCSSTSNVQIHGFCDASTRAYAAVIYMRVENQIGEVTVRLLTAKTKVAPIKPTTIPRLELNGAVLLSKLLSTVNQDMQLGATPIVAWTDSTIALHWIKSHASKWKTYVANRVAEIQENVGPECWKHVPTESNPADIASRGIGAKEFQENKLWWNGPTWLTQPNHEWPNIKLAGDHVQLEAKKSTVVSLIAKDDNNLMYRYSEFGKLQRTVATIARFCHNARKNNNKIYGQLTRNELTDSAIIIFKTLQKTRFKEEYSQLSTKRPISNKSSLLTLNPFLDEHGIIRVGGRLDNANMSYNRKHPIILPAEHHVTQILIDEFHKDTLHGGVGLVLNTSRHLYWIVNAKRVIANRINKCTTCIRHRKQTKSQLMGNLPKARVNIAKPFTNVGIDYAGPIPLKMSSHRNTRIYKGYFCIFVCMATKAIHLELVSDLTATAFIAALKRFVSRRGLCTNIFSDCGTNFKGAALIIDKELRMAIKTAIGEAAKLMSKKSITWHFNPPAAPHFGGLWEAGVKSVKYHLSRVIGKATYTFEEYTTLLTQVEACLNSRPLCQINNAIEDLEVLTPGHFLIGQPLNAVPEPDLVNQKISSFQRWKHMQYLVQQFWNKWSKDYLNQLQQRPKWCNIQQEVKVGDVVILKEDNTPPTFWPLGLIVATFPGKDGFTRVVEVRTATNNYKRPITKICVLPMETANEQPTETITNMNINSK